MQVQQTISRYLQPSKLLALAVVVGLVGCGGSSDDNDSTGYVKFYNGSKNAPALYLTLDADLDDDSDDDLEVTFTGVAYTQALSNYEIASDDYYYELGWQDEDSTDRDDLTLVSEGQLKVKKDAIQLLVASDSISAPNVQVYEVDVIDDDEDSDNDLFNLRILHLHPDAAGIDLYMSKSDQSFNEAMLIGQYGYGELSENQKLAQEEYTFYITLAGGTEVLYQSSEVDYAYPSQYIMVVRENSGAGLSSYALDRISSASTIEYLDANSATKFRAYNAITTHELLPDYQGTFDLYLNDVDDSAEVSALAQGKFSTTQTQEKGDYSISLVNSDTEQPLLANHLLSLAENSNKTVFFYLNEENVDHDGDGDVDEDGDGLVDEIEVTVNSLVVNNSTRASIYDHQIGLINLADSDDFNLIKFYFVRSDETIDTATNKRNAVYVQPESINLLNNTYQVFAIANIDNSDIILASAELVLNEDSAELFLVMEADVNSASGYKMSQLEQTAPQ